MAQGKFIAFEGIDGSGHSTQAALLRQWVLDRGMECYLTKEPSDGPFGALIRLVLADRLAVEPDPLALLFAADRMDHLVADIQPKLQFGVNVITDRYLLSSLAYQSLESDLEWIRSINALARAPDLSIIVDTPTEICLKRMQRDRWHVELYEDGETLERVRKNYIEISRQLALDGHRVVVVDGTEQIDSVHETVLMHVEALFKQRRPITPLDQLTLIPTERERDAGT